MSAAGSEVIPSISLPLHRFVASFGSLIPPDVSAEFHFEHREELIAVLQRIGEQLRDPACTPSERAQIMERLEPLRAAICAMDAEVSPPRGRRNGCNRG